MPCLIRVSNISLKVLSILPANTGRPLDGMCVKWCSVKYFWPKAHYYVQHPRRRGRPPILCMHAMSPKARSLVGLSCDWYDCAICRTYINAADPCLISVVLKVRSKTNISIWYLDVLSCATKLCAPCDFFFCSTYIITTCFTSSSCIVGSIF